MSNSNKVKIIGVSEFLPGKSINNKKMEEKLGLKEEWIDIMLGNKERYFCMDVDTNKVAYNLVDICTEAGKKVLDNTNMIAEEIDLLILSTATPDLLMPSSVNMVAEKLGMNNIATYQIQTGCAGCIQAMQLARNFIGEGYYNNALVISGDTTYKFFDINKNFNELPSEELINWALFGDGAGACIISNNISVEGLEILHLINKFEGLSLPPGHIVNWLANEGNNSVKKDESKSIANEDYKAIENNVPRMTKELLEELYESLQKDQDEIQYFLPPQLNAKMTKYIIDYCGLEETKCINRVEYVGNTGNSTPYFQLTKLWDILKKGDNVVLTAIESSKWIKTGAILNYN